MIDGKLLLLSNKDPGRDIDNEALNWWIQNTQRWEETIWAGGERESVGNMRPTRSWRKTKVRKSQSVLCHSNFFIKMHVTLGLTIPHPEKYIHTHTQTHTYIHIYIYTLIYHYLGKDPDAGQDWGQEERGRAGGEGNDRRWEGWTASWTEMDGSLSNLQEMVKYRGGWHAAVHGVAKNWTWLSNWTTTKYII